MERVLGVKEAAVSLETKTAVVSFDDEQTSVDAIAEAARLAGFPASLKE